jgi:hypothetical protein
MLQPESVPAYRSGHADLSRAFVPGGCWFFTVNVLERRNALRLLRPTALARKWAPPLFQRQNDRTRYRIGDPEATAKVFKRVPEGIECGNHVRPRLRERIRVGPFGDDAISTLAGLDDVGMFKARPIESPGAETGSKPTAD